MEIMKFRKRITVIPGVRLNISRSGVSVTGGIPGLSVNVGKKGAYLNTGVPGTGLYERTRIGGKSGSTGPGRRVSAGGVSVYELTGDQLVQALSLRFAVEADGSVGTFLPDGDAVTDPRILRKVRRSVSFRQEAEQLRESFVEDCARELKTILDIHRRTPAVADAGTFRRRMTELTLQEELPRVYETPPPAREDVKAVLEREARRVTGWWPVWNRRRRRRDYLHSHLEERLAEETRRWHAAKDEFDTGEAHRVALRNQALQTEYREAKAHLQGLLAGDPDGVSREVERLLERLEYPLPLDIDVEVDQSGTGSDPAEDSCTVFFDVDLPEIEDLPDETVRILSTGKLSVKSKSDRRLRDEYARAVAALALFIGGHGFAASPAVVSVRVHGYTQRVDPATGKTGDVSVLDVTMDRSRFNELEPAAGDPLAMVKGFEPALCPDSV
jgi:hypothetical protein